MAYIELRGMELDSARKANDIVFNRAMKSLNNKDDIEVRDLRPEDLKITNPAFTFSLTTTSNWHTVINNLTIDNQTWIAIYGVQYFNTSKLLTSVRITAGGALKMYRPIEGIEQTQNKILWFDPVLIDQQQTLKVEAYNNTTTTNTAESLVFFGRVAEKAGKVLAPTPKAY